MSAQQTVSTRFATAQDAGVVHGMLLRLAASMRASDKISSTEQDMHKALSGPDPAMHAIIAEGAQAPIGLAVFFLTFSTWRGTRGVYLQDIYVADSARASGLGARLLREVADWARERGADHLRLSVDRDNPGAQSFYDKQGLSHREDEMIYTIVGKAFTDLGNPS